MPFDALPLPMILPPAGDQADNDVTERPRLWRRWPGDDWAAFDALPPSIRRRLQDHAYDGWAVNAWMLWRSFRRQTGSSARAERRLLRYLDDCEAKEREAFAEGFWQATGTKLPHVAAAVSVLRAR
ncbi:DUF6525 family protein [Roseomonas sp. F4]